MSRGRLMCSEEVIREFNDPEKLMLMYRFSMEVEKARLSLDLNVDVVPRMGDHIVPTAANHPVVNQPISDTNQFNLNGGFSMVKEYGNIWIFNKILMVQFEDFHNKISGLLKFNLHKYM